jgi:hypothetical protein
MVDDRGPLFEAFTLGLAAQTRHSKTATPRGATDLMANCQVGEG